MDFYRHLFTKTGAGAPITFSLVYLISIIFTFQTLLTAYSSSTYIEQFIAPRWFSLIYAVSAAGAIALSLILPRILRAIGNVATIFILMALITICLVFIGLALDPISTIVAFTLFLVFNPQIYLNIDIFLETLIGEDESGTGGKRGLILTIMSAAAFVAPLTMGYIIGEDNNLSAVYFVGAAVGFLFIAVIIARFRHFYDAKYQTILVRDMLREAAQNAKVRVVMGAQFLLQFFYAWAIIYIPLFLARDVGLEWPIISQILAVGLLAFVIFEYPIGILADSKYGEKEMMAIGFVILALASASLSFMVTVGVAGWMALMFFSRVGASLVEVTTESYFFKQVGGDEPNLISLFRLMRPLAGLAGALVGSLSLFYMPLNLIFIVLAFVMVIGVFISSRLIDTK